MEKTHIRSIILEALGDILPQTYPKELEELSRKQSFPYLQFQEFPEVITLRHPSLSNPMQH